MNIKGLFAPGKDYEFANLFYHLCYKEQCKKPINYNLVGYWMFLGNWIKDSFILRAFINGGKVG